MSTALTSTANRLGTRTLAGYRPRGVYRSPAQAAPRAASSVQNVRLGFMTVVDPTHTDPRYIRIDRVTRSTIYSNGSASQSPTGAVYNSGDHFGTQAAHPTEVLPATPTSVATIAPAPASGTQVISSGGGTVVPAASESYITEVEAWLTSKSLLQSLFPSLLIPNWVPLLAGAAFVGTFWGGSGGRRR